MCVVSIKIPDEILLDLHEDKLQFEKYAKQMIAMDLYKNKKISLGYCATIAEMPKEEFIVLLGKNDISIFSFDSEDEFSEEVLNA
ncbi:UPF0175 family protein [Anaerosporobacter sp.]|uniref:UPF0175 family protein n=1 Tax=Anaerosporobacter sp. TaxID=1872529 RepID=UPI00286EF372|nr:UPF0175 family protein [Anaerosporobacter sp.]